MKTILAITAIALIGLIGTPIFSAQAADKTNLVLFYSDYCGQCKILEPKLKEALNDVDKGAITFIKFDYTDRDRIMASKDVAAENGLTELQKKYGAKTGFAILTDSDGHELGQLSASDSVEELYKKITGALVTKG